jgi:hypothetical protein
MEEMAEPVHFIPQQSQLTSPTFDHTLKPRYPLFLLACPAEQVYWVF